MATVSRFINSDFVGVRLSWAALLLISLAAAFWQDLRSLTWVGRIVLMVALAAFGVVDGLLVPRLRDRALVTVAVTIVELGCIILVGWCLFAMRP
jgi:hypothetical protein